MLVLAGNPIENRRNLGNPFLPGVATLSVSFIENGENIRYLSYIRARVSSAAGAIKLLSQESIYFCQCNGLDVSVMIKAERIACKKH